jgi:outer membrane immunogenic protein
MRFSRTFATCFLVGLGGPALAAAAASDLDRPSLPTFALSAPPADPSPWTGLYVGSEVFGVSGSKGVKGGFGGGGYAGYNRELDNGIVLGVRGSVGYVPGLYKYSAVSGWEYGAADLTLGYDMGRFMPFVTAGVGVARPNFRSFGYQGVNGVANDLFNSTGDLRAFESVGAGFAYKVTDKLTVELAVQTFHGNGFVAP